MNSESLNSEFRASRHVHLIQLKNDNGRIANLQFLDSTSAALINKTIRHIFGIKQNEPFVVGYFNKHTGKNAYLIADGQRLSECVMMGIKMFNVSILYPSESQLSSVQMSRDRTIKNNKTNNQRQLEPTQIIDDRIMNGTSRCDESDKNCSRECLLTARPSWLSIFNDTTARMWHWIKNTDTKHDLMHPKSD